MDPLSIAASVTGLLAFGGKVVSNLLSIADRAGDAPNLARSLLQEVSDISAILDQLDGFIQGRVTVSPDRGSMIPFKHVVASFSGCVMTYSDLQQQLDEMGLGDENGGMGIFDRLAWVRKETAFEAIVQRLQNHKASMTLMLTILQCQASQETERCILQLHQAVKETLRANQLLAERMNFLEQHGTMYPNPGTSREMQYSKSLAGNASVLEDDRVSFRSTMSRFSVRSFSSIISRTYQSFRPAFELDLETSRVYRGTARHARFSTTSMTSSALYSTALSLLSGLSWAQVSEVSVFALPVFSSDLSNSEYYPWSTSEEHIAQNLGNMQPGRAYELPKPGKLNRDISGEPQPKLLHEETPLSDVGALIQKMMMPGITTTVASELYTRLPSIANNDDVEIGIPSPTTNEGHIWEPGIRTPSLIGHLLWV
ncbi:putative CAMK CAMKL KIN4 protein kinase [Rosellinia necatrix]|uniref:Putative CAMK CAMKL KIN4 protein kinase n=1 Tax=Rosellinia necatrix TaxID=77044 RepID=A0A1W2TJ09_ROSNE|nr:putative CAMK CAMKL KIN4 protein kinase [Rosellinia necatrix]